MNRDISFNLTERFPKHLFPHFPRLKIADSVVGVSLLLVNILPQVSFDKMHLNCCLRGLTPIFKSSAQVSCSCQRNVAESFCKCCGKNYLFVNICFLQVAEQDVTETNVQLNSSRLIKQLDKVF